MLFHHRKPIDKLITMGALVEFLHTKEAPEEALGLALTSNFFACVSAIWNSFDFACVSSMWNAFDSACISACVSKEQMVLSLSLNVPWKRMMR